MKHASDRILEALKERGYRVTAARRELARVLTDAAQPRTIRELAERAKSDEASAYRFMRTLVAEGLAREIAVRGERPRFEVAEEHHHHVVCTGCGTIAHVPCAYTPHVPNTLRGFAAINEHELTFYGRCIACK